jgi:hypothetical protein
MSGHYITATAYGRKGKLGTTHWRPDPRYPVTACGVDFTGTHATTYPVTTGGAFSCEACEQAWRKSEVTE